MLLFSLAAVGTAAGAIYVDATATAGAKDGTSWADAYIYLQDALAEAVTEPDEIRVAQDTYRPDRDSAHPTGSKQRTATFQLLDDVEIYGGFPSGGCLWGDRDPNRYLTILTGDLNGDDGPDFANNADNSYHVVTASSTSATAVLDGFTITAGNADAAGADSYGGGIYNNSGDAVITNCTVISNRASLFGGGMYNCYSLAVITNCTFKGNSSELEGGGMYNDEWADVLISKCTFIENSAYDGGGGIYHYWANSIISNCTFVGNIAQFGFGPSGGAILNKASSYPILTNCLFSGNLADYGGAICSYYSDPSLFDCTLSGNSAVFDGGGLYGYESDPTIKNCILWANTDNSVSVEDTQIYVLAGSPVVTYSCIQGLDTFTGSGNIGDNPLFERDPNDGGDGWGDDPCTPGVDEGDNDDYGDLRLSVPVSPCVDTGSNAAVPTDAADLDDDGNTAEKTPWDLDGNARILDGNADSTATVDMGALEFARANIVRNPAQFTFIVSRPGYDSDTQSLYISNSGAGQLNWQITFGCNWLNAEPDTGSSTSSPYEVLLSTETSGLTWGSYSCQGTISSPDAVNSPQTFHVDLTIIKGDFDADEEVEFVDFSIFASTWSKAQGQVGYNPVCDIAEPSNDFIDEADLAAFAENWLQGRY